MASISLFLLSLFLTLCPALSQAPNKISLKVNFGGGPVADFLGEDQALDMSAFAKNVARHPIQNTDQSEVFQSQRFSRGADMSFRIPVPDGIYSVTLLFAETFKPACVPGARVFDISIGTPVSGLTKVVDAFDVFQAAGCTAAHGKRFDNVPSKEGIVVHLTQRAQHPSVAGFIVEGYPQIRGDGQEYKAIARAPADPALGGSGEGGQVAGMNGGGATDAVASIGISGTGAATAMGDGAVPSNGAVTSQGMQSAMTSMPGAGGGGTMGTDGEAGGAAVLEGAGGYGLQGPSGVAQGSQFGGIMPSMGRRRRLLEQKDTRRGVLAEFMKWTTGKQEERKKGKTGKRSPVSAEELKIRSEEEIQV